MERLLSSAGKSPGYFRYGLVAGNLLVAAVLCFATVLNLQASRAADPARAQAAADHLAGFTALVILLVACGSVYVCRQHASGRRMLAYAARLARQQNLIIENDWVGMIRVRNREVQWANHAVTRLLGYSNDRLVGSTTRMLYADSATYDMIGEQGYGELRTRGHFHTQVQMHTHDGKVIWVDFSGTSLSEDESLWMLLDIDRLKHSEQDAQQLALHDGLTGLANRRLLDEQLRQALAQTRRSGQHLAACYLDLDRFKPVNDQHGHQAGDEVLRCVADRLVHEVRAHDVVARLGGDEFALMLVELAQPAEALPILERCMAAVNQAIPLSNGQTVQVGCSIGVAFGTQGAGTPHELLAAADAAMYHGKRTGRGRIVLADSLPPA